MWRDTGRPYRIAGLDGRAIFPALIFFVHISKITLVLVLCSFVAFAVLEHFQYSVPNARRRFGVLLWGTRRPARAWWRD